MQSVSLYDYLRIEKGEKYSLIICNDRISGENIITKAWRNISDYVGSEIPVVVHLKKNIPQSAGLGGGSSDAGAFILALNKLFKLELNRQELLNIAAKTGSDVPFFIGTGMSIVQGRGEIIHQINLPMDYYIVLIVPKFVVNTGEAYSNLRNYLTPPDNVSNLLNCDSDELFWDLVPEFANSFNDLILEQHPEVADHFRLLEDFGAEYVSVSGSGSSYFGIFRNRENAISASEFDWNSDVFLLKPVRIEKELYGA